MRGRKKTPRHIVLPDPKYQSIIVAKFINHIMQRGKKTVARGVLYDAFDIMAEKTKREPMDVFELALKNVSPQVEVKSRRVGGGNYQVPIEVRPIRRMTLAMRWIIAAAQNKKGRPMCQKLADELVLASQNEGDAIKKKMDVHRMAEANRAFAHFA